MSSQRKTISVDHFLHQKIQRLRGECIKQDMDINYTQMLNTLAMIGALVVENSSNSQEWLQTINSITSGSISNDNLNASVEKLLKKWFP